MTRSATTTLAVFVVVAVFVVLALLVAVVFDSPTSVFLLVGLTLVALAVSAYAGRRRRR